MVDFFKIGWKLICTNKILGSLEIPAIKKQFGLKNFKFKSHTFSQLLTFTKDLQLQMCICSLFLTLLQMSRFFLDFSEIIKSLSTLLWLEHTLIALTFVDLLDDFSEGKRGVWWNFVSVFNGSLDDGQLNSVQRSEEA